jgi:lipopolysaccharide/colanic/teichoic acid biosynthesis glycosyltransferase
MRPREDNVSACKRLFDLSVGLMLVFVLAPVLLILLGVVLICDGRPVLHFSERMQAPERAFRMWKIRTMAQSVQGDGVTGGHSVTRITTTGKWLRKRRLDELPQLWNVLRGEMSLVGPRPPLRRYVARFPALYEQVLQMKPGVTGLGTLRFVHHEERVLSECRTARETDEVYTRYCLRRKARIDLAYGRHWSLWLDMHVLWRTACAFFRGFQG